MSAPSRNLIAALVVSFVAVGLVAGALGAALGGARVANAPAANSDLLTLLAGRREPAAVAGVASSVLAANKSVVRLTAHTAKRGEVPLMDEEVLGAGAMFTTDGWILTYRDVVQPGGKAVSLDAVIGGVRYVVEKTVVDPFSQAAFVKIAGDRLPVMPLVKDPKLAVGDVVYAFDAIGGLLPGMVSAIGMEPSVEPVSSERSALQYRLVMAVPARLGSPIVVADGSAIGVVDRADGEGQIVTVVPFGSISRSAEAALSGGTPGGIMFGVRYRDLESLVVDSVSGKAEERESGSLIVGVVAGSPAERAGLKVGDVIVAVNGEVPTVRAPLSDIVARYAGGATLTVDYRRDGVAKTAMVTLTGL